MKTNQGLNGVWGWVKRHVHGIAAVCTAVGLAPLAFALETIVAATGNGGGGSSGGGDMGDNTMGKMGDYEPTANEASILDPWVEKKLTPFYKNLLLQIKSAFVNSDHNVQLQIINDVIMKMCVIRTYYATHDTTGISAPAINLRNELINNIFKPIENIITDSITNDSAHLTNYVINSFATAQFLPLNIQSISLNCEKYVKDITYSLTTPLLSSTPVIVNPITNHIISGPNTTTSYLNTTTPNPSTTNSSTGIILLSILGLVIMFYPSDKKKNK